MNLFHDNDFIFNNPYTFSNRFDGRQDFSMADRPPTAGFGRPILSKM